MCRPGCSADEERQPRSAATRLFSSARCAEEAGAGVACQAVLTALGQRGATAGNEVFPQAVHWGGAKGRHAQGGMQAGDWVWCAKGIGLVACF